MANRFLLLQKRTSNFLLLVLFFFLISGEIVTSSDAATVVVRRLRRKYESHAATPPIFQQDDSTHDQDALESKRLATDTRSDEQEEDGGRKEDPLVAPSHIMMMVNDMENMDAYEKCFTLLEQESGGDVVTRSEYVSFLGALTDGDLDYVNFDDLPELFKLIFYSTACTSGQDCVHENPSISLNTSGVSLRLQQFLCRQVMVGSLLDSSCSRLVLYLHSLAVPHVSCLLDLFQNVTNTEVIVTFGYSIRYDSADVASGDLETCLEIATENLLLDSFDCPYDVTTERRRLSSTHSLDPGDGVVIHDPLVEEFTKSAFRYLEENLDSFPSAAPTPSPSPAAADCEYTITATVDSITDIRKLMKLNCVKCNLVRGPNTHFLLVLQPAELLRPTSLLSAPWSRQRW
jgi:hypothetical protein